MRLIPAQYVKPFVKTNKNDFIDAEAIAEAVAGPRCALCRSRARTVGYAVAASGARTLDNASDGGGEPDPWLAAGARHHGADGKVPSRCSLAGDSGGRSTIAVGSTCACCWSQLKQELEQLAATVEEAES